jgi:hypothetical protein
VLAVVIAVTATAPSAHAATVRMSDDCGYPGPDTHVPCDEHVTFAAAPGEANYVTRTHSGTTMVVRDEGAPVTAGNGCAQVDPHAVSCFDLYLDVQTLDGDDRVEVGYPAGVSLGMDYEVFLVSRVREAFVHHGDPKRAIVEGYGQSGAWSPLRA